MDRKAAIEQFKKQFPDALVEEKWFLGEATLTIKQERIRETLLFFKQVPGPGFEVLMDLTAVDYLHPEPYTKVVYWLHQPENLERLRLVIIAQREGTVPSVMDIFPGADWYEREVFDFFGIRFEGHSHLTRILMPDDWKGHPLLRDYPLTEEPVEFKHGVKPKVPSEIIPYVRR